MLRRSKLPPSPTSYNLRVPFLAEDGSQINEPWASGAEQTAVKPAQCCSSLYRAASTRPNCHPNARIAFCGNRWGSWRLSGYCTRPHTNPMWHRRSVARGEQRMILALPDYRVIWERDLLKLMICHPGMHTAERTAGEFSFLTFYTLPTLQITGAITSLQKRRIIRYSKGLD